MNTSEILGLNLPEDSDPSAVGPLNENFLSLEKAIATFDHLCQVYGATTTYPDADTGTITCTVDSSAPVAATRQTVVSESDGTRTYVETTTIGGASVTRTWTEGTTTASEVIADE